MEKHTCERCKKVYKYVSGLSRHKKKCKSLEAINKDEWKKFIITEIKKICEEEFIKKTFQIMRENENLKVEIDRMKEYNEDVVLPGIEAFQESSKEKISELKGEVSRLKAKIKAYET